MSRSGYIDDGIDWDWIKWRGWVASSIRGRRGQALLRDMLAALDALPSKRLIRDELIDDDGEVCLLGAVGLHRGLDVSKFDPDNHYGLAAAFDTTPYLIAEIEHENDDGGGYWRNETPEQRFDRVRRWVEGKIR